MLLQKMTRGVRWFREVTLEFVSLRVAVACSLGTWYNLATGTCEFCPAGTYQDSEGQLSCQPCPHRLYGVGTEGANSPDECGGQCGQDNGTYVG